jgi:multidrug transporter EmrE-like cation transporter
MKLTNVTFLYVLLFVLAIVVIECAAQYCLKKYAKCEGYQWFVLGVAIYSVVAFLLVLCFDYEKMAIVNIMWGSLSALILTFMAYYFYGEKLTWQQILGIIVILIGTWLIHTS